MPSFFNTWLPFIYLYGIGALCFIAGMLIIRKAKSIDMRRKQHRYWWKVMWFGLIYFMAIHTFLILAALYL